MIKFSQQPVTKQQKIVFPPMIWIGKTLEGYKIKSTLAYKIFSTLLLHRRWERRYRVIVFLARRYLQIENEGWGLT